MTAVRVLRRELELIAFVRTHPNLVFLWHKGYHRRLPISHTY